MIGCCLRCERGDVGAFFDPNSIEDECQASEMPDERADCELLAEYRRLSDDERGRIHFEIIKLWGIAQRFGETERRAARLEPTVAARAAQRAKDTLRAIDALYALAIWLYGSVDALPWTVPVSPSSSAVAAGGGGDMRALPAVLVWIVRALAAIGVGVGIGVTLSYQHVQLRRLELDQEERRLRLELCERNPQLCDQVVPPPRGEEPGFFDSVFGFMGKVAIVATLVKLGPEALERLRRRGRR